MSQQYDGLMSLLRQRRSRRAFAPVPLAEATLAALGEAFSLAPSAGNRQDARCSFVTEPERIQSLADRGATAFAALCGTVDSPLIREEMERYGKNFFWFGNAPALACVTCRRSPAFLEEGMGAKAALIWGGELSAAMSAFALLLAAESLGLGGCCLTGPLIVRRELETSLGLSKREALVLLIALGYPKDRL